MRYTKKEHMLLLIRMALADEKLKISERQVLQEHSQKLDITAGEYLDLLKIARKNSSIDWRMYKSLKKEYKILIIEDLIDVMKVDGHIDLKEIELLNHFCTSLDVDLDLKNL